MAQSRLNIAETSDRVIAGIIDLIIADILWMFIGPTIWAMTCCTCFPALFLGNIYLLLKDFGSASIGKRMMKLKVVKYDTGQDITFGDNFMRNITSCICPGLWLSAFLNEEGRRLGDNLGNTIVISEK